MLRWSCVHILAQGPCQGQYNIQDAIIVEAVALTEVCWNEHEEQRRMICKLILHTHRVHHCCLRVIPDNVLDSNIFLENCSRPTSRVETSTAKRQKMTFLTQVNMLPFYKTPTILIYQQQLRGEFTESWLLQTILSSSCS